MAHTIFKSRSVVMDLLVKKEFWPELMDRILKSGVQMHDYTEEDHGNGDKWVVVHDISSIHGYELGDLIGQFYQMEKDGQNKFYILLKSRKRRVFTNDRKNRQKAHPGSKGGNTGRSEG